MIMVDQFLIRRNVQSLYGILARGIRRALDKLVRNFGEDFAGPDKLSGVES